ncbi:cation:proton antiporter, partial [Ancrocorticia sp.]|uniref:cation:proton antiporter n=1 Tax=Ancrocorticia sp. TaxID=2593684 RepID=UPI003F923ED9
ELGAISGLSIVLVIISTGLVGGLLWLLIPDLDLAWALALGAVISPTDAVAVSIVKKTGVSPRVISILQGEGLLNDASALVMLRTAVAAAAASVTVWGVAGSLLWAVVGAAVVGIVVGKLNLAVRSRISNTTATTTLSFAIPFIAMAGAEAIGASGLVGAVVAGLITGQGAATYLSPSQRISDSQNWETIEFILEGIIFLTMGLEFHSLVTDLSDSSSPAILIALGVAVLALIASIIVRALFVYPLLHGLEKRAVRREPLKPHFEALQDRLANGETGTLAAIGTHGAAGNDGPEEVSEVPAELLAKHQRRLSRRKKRALRRGQSPEQRRSDLAARLRRVLADLDYFLASPLTKRDGGVIVWAGMRGAITVAAAQTLPLGAPMRSYLVFIAFLVALLSLMIQGGTLAPFVKWVKPTPAPTAQERAAEHAELTALLDEAKEELIADCAASGQGGEQDELSEGSQGPRVEGHVPSQLKIIEAQRKALLKARDDHQFDAEILEDALEVLDASQVTVEMRARSLGE